MPLSSACMLPLLAQPPETSISANPQQTLLTCHVIGRVVLWHQVSSSATLTICMRRKLAVLSGTETNIGTLLSQPEPIYSSIWVLFLVPVLIYRYFYLYLSLIFDSENAGFIRPDIDLDVGQIWDRTDGLTYPTLAASPPLGADLADTVLADQIHDEIDRFQCSTFDAVTRRMVYAVSPRSDSKNAGFARPDIDSDARHIWDRNDGFTYPTVHASTLLCADLANGFPSHDEPTAAGCMRNSVSAQSSGSKRSKTSLLWGLWLIVIGTDAGIEASLLPWICQACIMIRAFVTLILHISFSLCSAGTKIPSKSRLRTQLSTFGLPLLLLGATLSPTTSSPTPVPGLTFTALSSLYSATAGENWYTKTNWMSGDPCTAGW